MITIIDRTIGHVNTSHAGREALSSFFTSLFKSGVTHIEGTPALFFRVFPELAHKFKGLSAIPSCLLSLDHYQNLSLNENPYQQFDISKDQQPDTEGSCSLTGISDLLATDELVYFMDLFQTSPFALNFCPDNRLHCGTALAMEWITLGGQSVSASFTGIGQMAPLEEVLMSLTYHCPDKFEGDLSNLQTAKKAFLAFSQALIPANKPVLGERIFKVESGIHVDGILKNPAIYEPFDPRIVGQEREIVLGKHSGQKSIDHKLKSYQLSDSCLKRMLQTIRERCSQLGRNLSDLELANLVMEVQNDAKIYC